MIKIIDLIKAALKAGSVFVYKDEAAMLSWIERSLRIGKTKNLETFLAKGGNPNIGIDSEYPIIERAVDHHNLRAVDFLLESGALTFKTDQTGWGKFNCLTTAAFNGYWDIAQILLETGMRVDQVWMSSTTALHEACMMRCGHPYPAWDYKGELNTTGEIDRFSRTVKLLIESGANINAVCMDWPGPHVAYTPLHFAVESDCLQIVDILLQSGADIGLTTDEGCTALDLAVRSENHEIADLLRGHRT